MAIPPNIRNKRSQDRTRWTSNITPLVDIAFQLIVFFMVVSQVVSAHNEPLRVPDPDSSKAKQRPAQQYTVVNLFAGSAGTVGKIKINATVLPDMPALAEIIGKDRFVERLDWGFRESYKTRFNGLNDQYWDYPVIQGNQQSMHFAFLFNWVDHPWLTQKWSRSILERYYGYGISNAYLGDEDQGQMSAWFIMAAIGLFQTDGGCSFDPIYEIGSPLYENVEIDLGKQYGRGNTFIIEAKNASRLNMYVQSAKLNGKALNNFKFPSSELLKGGKLELVMGSEPNKNWGISR